jgi:hypothetical protein
LVIGFVDHSQVVTTTKCNTLVDFHTTNDSTLNFFNVLSLVFTTRFLATDLSLSHPNYSICTAFNSHIKSSRHSLIPLLLSLFTADSLNSDLRLSLSLSLFCLNSWQLTIWHISSSSDWTLHWNYSDFQMNSQLLLVFRYTASGWPHRKRVHCLAMDVLYCSVFVGTCLHSNGLLTKNLSPREGVYQTVA